MKKEIVSLSLSTCLLIGGMAFADKIENTEITNDDKVSISEKVEISQKVEESSYKNYIGEISEVIRQGNELSIVVASTNESSDFKNIRFNISEESIILSDKTQNFIESEKLEKGMNLEVFYGSDSPMTRSIPPMTNAKVIVLREAKQEDRLAIKVDTFNEDLISRDNFLKLNTTEDTVMVDVNGEKLEKSDLYNRDLIAFYGPIMTLSIPGESKVVKIIALDEKEEPEEVKEVKSLEKIIYNGKEINLKDKMYKSQEVVMMPIREIGESLGYEVSWNGEARQAELKKGANFLTANADEDLYSFAKMIVKLGVAPQIDNGTMYVPVDFIEKVMMLEMEVTEEGAINIK